MQLLTSNVDECKSYYLLTQSFKVDQKLAATLAGISATEHCRAMQNLVSALPQVYEQVALLTSFVQYTQDARKDSRRLLLGASDSPSRNPLPEQQRIYVRHKAVKPWLEEHKTHPAFAKSMKGDLVATLQKLNAILRRLANAQ